MKAILTLLILTLVSLNSSLASAAFYVGKTNGSRTCSLDDSSDFSVTLSIQGGASYSLRKRSSMEYVETDLIHDGGRNYREPLGAIITFFGLGVKSVVLNLNTENSTPSSYHLEVSGIFNDIDCHDLVKQ